MCRPRASTAGVPEHTEGGDGGQPHTTTHRQTHALNPSPKNRSRRSNQKLADQASQKTSTPKEVRQVSQRPAATTSRTAGLDARLARPSSRVEAGQHRTTTEQSLLRRENERKRPAAEESKGLAAAHHTTNTEQRQCSRRHGARATCPKPGRYARHNDRWRSTTSRAATLGETTETPCLVCRLRH